MHITLRQLEIFRAVAQSGRVTAAAEALHISQPAASMALSELEKHLGSLFDRHLGSSLALNDAGYVLLPKACEMMDRALEIERQFNKKSQYREGVLYTDASSTVGNHIMPSIINQFSQTYPNVRIDLTIGSSCTIEKRILDFETDLAIIERICLHPDIETTPWYTDQLCIICHPKHKLAGKLNISALDLAKEDWLIREAGSGAREIFETIIADKLKTPSIKLILNRDEAIKQAVIDGLGIACMSHLAVERQLHNGELATITINNLSLKRYFYLIKHKKKYCSVAFNDFFDFIFNKKINR